MEFWKRYAKVHGDHPIFSQGGVNFARTIAVLSHGDEGNNHMEYEGHRRLRHEDVQRASPR